MSRRLSTCRSEFRPGSIIIGLAWLHLLLLPLAGAFSPPVYRLSNLQSSFSSSATPASILQTQIDDDTPGLNHTAAGGEEDMLIPKPKFSKAKWKKKRYLMMQDVKKKIQQNDPSAPRKAEEMVRRMLKLYENSGNDIDYRPTQQAYNLWIHALAKSNLETAGELADQVMEQMRDQHVEPNAFTYTCVMDAYARSQSPEMAEDVLFRLLEAGPPHSVSEVTCDTMLNAWAQQGTEESAERAQLILYRLEEWQRDDIRPSKFSYTTGKSDCVRLARNDVDDGGCTNLSSDCAYISDECLGQSWQCRSRRKGGSPAA